MINIRSFYASHSPKVTALAFSLKCSAQKAANTIMPARNGSTPVATEGELLTRSQECHVAEVPMRAFVSASVPDVLAASAHVIICLSKAQRSLRILEAE